MKIYISELKNFKKEQFPQKINGLILLSLRKVNRSKYFYLFRNNIESLPLIMNLINAMAKYHYGSDLHSDSWYKYKDIIIKFLIKHYPRNWTNNGVVYFETPYEQISAHIFDKNIKLAKKYGMSAKADHRYWNEKHLQPIALKLIDEYINDATSKY